MLYYNLLDIQQILKSLFSLYTYKDKTKRGYTERLVGNPDNKPIIYQKMDHWLIKRRSQGLLSEPTTTPCTSKDVEKKNETDTSENSVSWKGRTYCETQNRQSVNNKNITWAIFIDVNDDLTVPRTRKIFGYYCVQHFGANWDITLRPIIKSVKKKELSILTIDLINSLKVKSCSIQIFNLETKQLRKHLPG